MCHNSASEQNAQIEKFMEQGMPRKVMRSVAHTLRKRALAREQQQRLQAEASSLSASALASASATASASDDDDDDDSDCSFCDDAVSIDADGAPASADSDVSRNDDNDEPPQTHGEEKTKSVALPNATPTLSESSSACRSPIILKCPFTAHQRVLLPAAALQQQPHNGRRSLAQAATAHQLCCVDALAAVTQWLRRCAEWLKSATQNVQRSKVYTVLTSTTQPAHVVAICIVSLLLYALWPELFASKAATVMAADGDIDAAAGRTRGGGGGRGAGAAIATIAYLGAFATHFGAQIWMTFVSGLSLYFSLPRHTFGQCQQILFPRYFALNATLSIAMLVLFVKYFLASSWNAAGWLQLAALALMAMIEVTVRLYLAPPMLRLMLEKYRIEEAIGSGREVGSLLVSGDLLQCPHYKRVHTSFRRIHITIAMGNMLVLVATCVQLYFLAARLQLN